MMGFEVKSNLSKGISKFFEVHEKASEKGMIALGLQLLNNTVNGSPEESVQPPILWGRLKGSGSIFFENKFVGDSLGVMNEAAQGATPNRSYSGKKNEITIGFNTPYAARMHENLQPYGENFRPGERSRQQGNVEGKFLERHLDSDKEELFFLYSKIVEKETSGGVGMP